eukprot:Pompholyxophrys_punicea_v1_NODE_1531_length_658_cov_48.913765.p1 type:complete len:107 gc:universal NODE_1531_length_658_cov_48.913765:553-233(-)
MCYYIMIGYMDVIQKKKKVVFTGKSGVGKSSLFTALNNKTTPNISTVGIDYYNRRIVTAKGTTNISFWDTGGCEKFNSITKQYTRDADVIVIVADLSNTETFHYAT